MASRRLTGAVRYWVNPRASAALRKRCATAAGTPAQHDVLVIRLPPLWPSADRGVGVWRVCTEVAGGVAICWRAGRRELITLGVLELLSGAGVAAEVVVGRQVLQAFLLTGDAASSGGGGWGRRVEQRAAG